MSKIKLYLASPWFTSEQDERETRVKGRLRELGFEVFSPRDETVLKADASKEDQQKVFEGDINGINDCDAVFANYQEFRGNTRIDIVDSVINSAEVLQEKSVEKVIQYSSTVYVECDDEIRDC